MEQLLPAVDHAEGFELVSADDRPEPVEGPGEHRWRPGDPEPGDHGLVDHDHPAGHRVPMPAEVLAVRPLRGRGQGIINFYTTAMERKVWPVLQVRAIRIYMIWRTFLTNHDSCSPL